MTIGSKVSILCCLLMAAIAKRQNKDDNFIENNDSDGLLLSSDYEYMNDLDLLKEDAHGYLDDHRDNEDDDEDEDGYYWQNEDDEEDEEADELFGRGRRRRRGSIFRRNPIRIPNPIRVIAPIIPPVPAPKPKKYKNPFAVPLPSIPSVNMNQLPSNYQQYFNWLNSQETLVKSLRGIGKRQWINDIAQFATAEFAYLEEICNFLFHTLVDGLRDAWQGSVDTFNQGINEAKKAKAMAGEVVDAFKKGDTGVLDAIGDWSKQAWKDAKQGVTNAWNAVTNWDDHEFIEYDYYNIHNDKAYWQKYEKRRRLAVCDIPDPANIYNEIWTAAQSNLNTFIGNMKSQSFYNGIVNSIADLDDDHDHQFHGQDDNDNDNDVGYKSLYRSRRSLASSFTLNENSYSSTNSQCKINYGIGFKFEFCGGVTLAWVADFAICVGVVLGTNPVADDRSDHVYYDPPKNRHLTSGLWEWSWSFASEIAAAGFSVVFAFADYPGTYYGAGWAFSVGGSLPFVELGAAVGIFGPAGTSTTYSYPRGALFSLSAGVGVIPVDIVFTVYGEAYNFECTQVSACDCQKKCYYKYPMKWSQCNKQSSDRDVMMNRNKYKAIAQ